MKCVYCLKQGDKYTIEGQPEVYMCEIHFKIMNTPGLAQRFLRGHLAQELRGTMSQMTIDKETNTLLELIDNVFSKMKRH